MQSSTTWFKYHEYDYWLRQHYKLSFVFGDLFACHAIVNRVGRRVRRHDYRPSPADIAKRTHLLGIANGEQFHPAPLEQFQPVLDLGSAAHRQRQRHVAGRRRTEGHANICRGQHGRGSGHARNQPRSRKGARNEPDMDGREWHRLTRRAPADCTRAPEAAQGRARSRRYLPPATSSNAPVV